MFPRQSMRAIIPVDVMDIILPRLKAHTKPILLLNFDL